MLNLFKFEQRIQEYIDAQLLVGVALAIVKGDAVIYARGFGMTSVEDGATPITPKTMFAIGSTSKTLCATLVMRLVEQGKLDLDRPVQAYLPNFTFSDPHKGSKVTLRHVLSHTTGLPSGGKNWGPRHPNALRDVVYDQIAYYRFFAEPGAVYHYSTVPIDLAGCTAEMVTGKYYEELMQELVFDPLDMTHSTYDRLVAMTYPLALPHVKIDGGVQVDHRYSDNPSGNPDGFGISCARDMANLASMFLNRGRFNGEQFLTPESIQTMHKPHGNQYWDGCSPLYTVIRAYSGLGFMIGQYHGIPTVGHTGGMQSFTTNFHLFPEQGLGLILLLNYLDYDTGGNSISVLNCSLTFLMNCLS